MVKAMRAFVAAGLAMVLVGCGQKAAPERAAGPSAPAEQKIGVYDSRAVAVAYAGSAAFGDSMAGLRAERDKAKAAGNEQRVAELQAQAAERQKLLHTQAFSTAPVDDIMKEMGPSVDAICKEQGVAVLVSKWDSQSLARHPVAKRVDVTMALVDALKPNARQRKAAIDIQQQKPIPLDQAEKING